MAVSRLRRAMGGAKAVAKKARGKMGALKKKARPIAKKAMSKGKAMAKKKVTRRRAAAYGAGAVAATAGATHLASRPKMKRDRKSGKYATRRRR